MTRRRFDFHGVGIEVTGEAAIIGAVAARFRHFEDASADIGIRFEFVGSPAERPTGDGRPVYEPPVGEVLYFEDVDALLIDDPGRLRVVCDAHSGRVAIWAVAGETGLWLLSRPMVTIPLVELLKRRGLYCVHAAAAAWDGRAVVAAAGSGAGKSTLALALVRGGFELMADDMVFVDGAARLHAFPDEVDVSRHTASLFGELHTLAQREPEVGWPKHRVQAEEVFRSGIALEADPCVLLLPSIGGGPVSAVTPVTGTEAFLELAPNVLLTEPGASQRHLDALGELVRRSTCYRLSAGRDPAEIARTIDSLLT